MIDNLIVGAGIAGLTLARELSTAASDTLILEKSRGVGGRLATRRDGEAAYDHGAQFLLSEAAPMLEELWSSARLLQTWFTRDGFTYRASPGGMTRLAKFLTPAGQLNLGQRASTLSREGSGWRVTSLEGQSWWARRVFLTPPLPQALELLQHSGLSYPPELAQIQYDQALVALFELAGVPTGLSYQENVSPEILSVANQHSKGVSLAPAVAVVMQPSWSESHFERDEAETLALIQQHFEALAGASVIKAQLKKWRYARPRARYQELYQTVAPGLYLLGDAFGGADIAGAHRSALALVEALKDQNHALKEGVC